MVENIIVATSKWRESDIPTLFKDEDVTFTEQTLIPNLLKDLGVFKSTSEAIRAGRKGSIPEGWTEFKASKKRRLWIWNPTE